MESTSTRCLQSRSLTAVTGGMAAFLCCVPVMPASAQTLSSYDSFSSPYLSALKWYGDEGRTYGGIRTEAHRSIVTGQARIELRTWGDVTSNVGFSSSRNSLVAVKSPTITAMQGVLTMRSATVASCASNATQPGTARARMFGFFFNSGDAVAGSNFNDVFAGVQLSRASNTTDAAGIFRVTGFSGVCADDSCIASTSLGSVDLGTAALAEAVQLKVSWDAINNRFAFQRAAQTTQYIAYSVADTLTASFPAKRLEISNLVPRCVGGTRPSVYASADFDNVYVNSTALSIRAPALKQLSESGDFSRVDPLTGPMN